MSNPSVPGMLEDASTEFHSHIPDLSDLQHSDKAMYQSSRPTSIKKRSRDNLALNEPHLSEHPPRASKIIRREDQLDCASIPPCDTERAKTGAAFSISPTSPYMSDPRRLTDTQETFIRQWIESFAIEDTQVLATNETINALATLVQAPPQPVFEYINQESYAAVGKPATHSTLGKWSPGIIPMNKEQVEPTSASYSFVESNRHLPPTTLALVEKYVAACRRRRPQVDGRRSVNDGPFRCTFGCGYRTKRAFDWRRHEETHEPQELWLCTLCSQNKEQSPLLVNRKDKFLKHTKDGHPEWEPETVLEMSKVDYRARFDPVCPICSNATSKTWEERCRHVLGHFEDEMEALPQSTSRKANNKAGNKRIVDKSRNASVGGSSNATDNELEN